MFVCDLLSKRLINWQKLTLHLKMHFEKFGLKNLLKVTNKRPNLQEKTCFMIKKQSNNLSIFGSKSASYSFLY